MKAHQLTQQLRAKTKLAIESYIGWPEPYIYTVYDRIFGEFSAKNTVYTPYIYVVLANPMCKPYFGQRQGINQIKSFTLYILYIRFLPTLDMRCGDMHEVIADTAA